MYHYILSIVDCTHYINFCQVHCKTSPAVPQPTNSRSHSELPLSPSIQMWHPSWIQVDHPCMMWHPLYASMSIPSCFRTNDTCCVHSIYHPCLREAEAHPSACSPSQTEWILVEIFNWSLKWLPSSFQQLKTENIHPLLEIYEMFLSYDMNEIEVIDSDLHRKKDHHFHPCSNIILLCTWYKISIQYQISITLFLNTDSELCWCGC